MRFFFVYNSIAAPIAINETPEFKHDPSKKQPPPPLPENDLFELPIPLDSTRKAYIRYPLNDLKKKDIKVIVRALSFIASSISDDGEDLEIVIKETKKEQWRSVKIVGRKRSH